MTGMRHWLVLLALGLLPACSSSRTQVNPATAIEPQLSVERFLQAANQRDFDAMSRLFGTAEGPFGETGSTLGCAFKKIGSWFGGQECRTRQEVELRMDAIASILRHRDYVVTQQQMVAGRVHPTTRVLVDLMVDDDEVVRGVPFVVVHGSDGRWMVQEIDLQRVMAGP
ncbi:MAG: hypothetical protein WD995_07770 [Gemmatimonadota bacterium]